MKDMYKGKPFPPAAFLTENIGAGDTVIKVSDIAAFPPAPNYATIGVNETSETIIYNAVTGDSLSGCIRGVEGTARAWDFDSPVAHNFTAALANNMIDNIVQLDVELGSAAEAAAKAQDSADEAMVEAMGANENANSRAPLSHVGARGIEQHPLGNGVYPGFSDENFSTEYKETVDFLAYTFGVIEFIPAQNGSLTFTGSTQSPSWSGFNPAQLDISGKQSSTDAGEYAVIFTPRGIMKWWDGTTAPKNAAWSISRATVTSTPSQNGSLTFTGSAQSPSWSGFNPAQLDIGGTQSAADAGTYTATFTPNGNHQWADGTATARTVNWSIERAAGSLGLSPASMALTQANPAGTITVTRPGDGAITAVSGNTAVAAAAVSGTAVTVTAVGGGSADITVSVAQGTNHNAPGNAVCAVTASGFMPEYDRVFNLNSWAQIDAVSAYIAANNMTAAQIQTTFGWRAGDTKNLTPVPIPGFSERHTMRIIGFRHDDRVSGGKAGISIELGPLSFGTLIAERRRMEPEGSNANGWGGCEMRNVHLPAIFNQLPADLQAVIKPVIKYTAAHGEDGTIISSHDILWLMSQFEITGAITSSFAGEGTRYALYAANDNNTFRIKQQPWGTNHQWWTRSPSTQLNAYRILNATGAATNTSATSTHGVSFGLCV